MMDELCMRCCTPESGGDERAGEDQQAEEECNLGSIAVHCMRMRISMRTRMRTGTGMG